MDALAELNKRADPVYSTDQGSLFLGDSVKLLSDGPLTVLRGHIQLVFTSPPFPLNRKKKYGNLQGEEYVDWLCSVVGLLKEYLSPTGSIVIELGNCWERGKPTMSTLATKALLFLVERNKLFLIQEFIWHNPAKLPTPVQWVNVERIRVKDNFTKLWWLSATERPKADNRNVLVPYSNSMKKLLKKKRYNSGRRPSEHSIGESSFLTNHGGAIPGNVISIANTASSDSYQKSCKEKGINPHPARMPIGLADFFIRFLTDENDIVLDPFAGSNVTGFASEKNSRRWIAIEKEAMYAESSRYRFGNKCKD